MTAFVTAVLWTAFFIVNVNVAMMIPLLPFIEAAIGLTPRQAGLVLAAFSVSALIGNLMLGPWLDRFGRRLCLTVGSAGCAALFALTALATDATTIAACRLGMGCFMPMLGASVFPAIADYIPAADRARVGGYVATSAPVAFLVSMPLGVLLSGYVAWQLPFLLVAGLASLLALAASRLPPMPPDALAAEPVTAATYRRRLTSLSMAGSTRLILLAYLCWSAAMFVFLGLYPTWIIQHGPTGSGPGSVAAILFLGGLGGLAGAFLSGRLAGRHGRPLRLASVAALASAAVVLAVPFGRDLFAAQALAFFGYAFGRDLMLALILGGAMTLVVPAERGSLNALLNVVYQSGATAGLLASVALYGAWPERYGANAAVAAAVFVLAGLCLWRIDGASAAGHSRP